MLSITATSIGVHRYILPEADQIIVEPGDLRGIHYPDGDDTVGVVPYMVSLLHMVFEPRIYIYASISVETRNPFYNEISINKLVLCVFHFAKFVHFKNKI